MAKGHRSQIKRARNENNKETRPSAKLSYARVSVQKACYVLDAIRGKEHRVELTESRREQAISPSCWMKDKEEEHGTES